MRARGNAAQATSTNATKFTKSKWAQRVIRIAFLHGPAEKHQVLGLSADACMYMLVTQCTFNSTA